MPQKRISIWTSRSVGSRRWILVDASGDVSLAAEYAFALYVVGCMVDLISFYLVAVLRVCGILECHIRVNPNSLLKMRIETQSSVALS